MTKMMLSVALIVVFGLVRGTDAAPVFSETGKSATASVLEDAAVGTSVYQLSVTDATGDVTYTVKEGEADSDIFEAPESEVKIKAGASLDYETKNAYTLTITATDTAKAVSDTPLTLTVNVENVAPSFTNPPGAVSIADKSPAETELVGNFVATDPGGPAVTYATGSGNTNNDFAIDASSGKVTVATGKTLDASTTRCYRLELEAADGATPKLTATTTVEVTVKADDSEADCYAGSGTAGLSVPVMLIFMCLLLFFQ